MNTPNLNHEFFLIVLSGRNEPYFAECGLADATFERVVDTIMTGQYDGEDSVVRVVMFSPDEGHSYDATEQVAEAIVARLGDFPNAACRAFLTLAEIEHPFEDDDRDHDASEADHRNDLRRAS